MTEPKIFTQRRKAAKVVLRAHLSFYALGNRILLTPCFSGVFADKPLKRFRPRDTGKHPAKAGC
jgi:hypothetical protein